MNLLTTNILSELLNVNSDNCVSLYMPTHRQHPDNLQDPILFKNLIKKLEKSLLQKFSVSETALLLEQFGSLENDEEFWNHTLDGLAVFSADGKITIIKLPVAIAALTVVAKSFHTKPLRKYLQSIERYNVLGLSRHDYHIYEGNRHSLTELFLPPGVPINIKEALGDELTDQHVTVASYGGVSSQAGNMHHGHGGKADEVDIDATRFFRFVSKTINEHYSIPSGLPLILAALPEHHNLFHKVSNINTLLPGGIEVNPKSVDNEAFVKRSWDFIAPYFNDIIDKFSDMYHLAKAQGKGSDNINEVAAAAAAGRVDTLAIESDRQIAGKIVNDSGNIEKGNLDNPELDDLLDDLGELVTKMGGKVMVIAPNKMPSDRGIAAIYRY